jgi:hypothetical protein
MALEDFYNDAQSRGGKWVKLANPGDAVKGEIIDLDIRDRRDIDGNVVLNRKSGDPRKEYVLTFRVDEDQREDADDDGARKISLNEAGQSAFIAAYKAAGGGDIAGARFALQMTTAAPNQMSQAGYAAAIKKQPKSVTLPTPATTNIDSLV